MKVIVNVHGIDAADPRLAAAAPGVEIVGALDDEVLFEQIAEADVLFGGRHLPELLPLARRLRWVHSASAGMEGYLRWTADRPDLILTSSAGAYDRPIAEHVMALLLALRRGIGQAVRQSVELRWQRLPEPVEVQQSTLGILGLGSIGRAVARMAAGGFMMRVLGHKARPVPTVEAVEQVYYGRAGLLAMLPQCDALVVSAALTDETRGLLDGPALDRLPRHAVVVNIARGAIIDEAALTDRLVDGRLAGAGLDVFDTEPLHVESRLWTLPHVIITPHNAGWSNRVQEHRLELFREQLQRYAAGEPLRNVVDRAAGY